MIALRGRRPILFGLLALMLLGFVTACEPTDVQLLQSFAQDWAKSKGLDPNTPSGWVNIATAAAVGTGDPQVDAAVDAALVVKNLQDADTLANSGLANGDITKVDQAIKLRPNDFTYVNDRGLVVLMNGDQNAVQAEFAKADSLAAAQGASAVVLNLRNRIAGLHQILVRSAVLVGQRHDVWNRQFCADSKALFQITANPLDLTPGSGAC